MEELLYAIIILFIGVLFIYINNTPPHIILKKKTNPDNSIIKCNNLLNNKCFGYKFL